MIRGGEVAREIGTRDSTEEPQRGVSIGAEANGMANLMGCDDTDQSTPGINRAPDIIKSCVCSGTVGGVCSVETL